MQKTKLGISVGLLGALAYFAGIFGGYQTLIIVAGYVLLFEENSWLKRTCVKALVLMLIFSVVSNSIGLIPTAFNWLSSCISILNIEVSFSFISKLVNVITGAINIVRTIIFLFLGVKSLNQGDMKINNIDNMVDKYM